MEHQNYWTTATRGRLGRRRLLRGGLATGLGLAGAALIGCGGGTSSTTSGTAAAGKGAAAPVGTPRAGGVLREGTTSSTSDLDPHASPTPTMFVSGRVFNSVLDLRMKQDLSGFDIKPSLAASFQQPDPLTYVFKLAPNIKTHNKPPVNGRNLTSEDVARNFKLIASPPKEIASQIIRTFNFEGVESIDTPDAETVRVKFTTPFSPFVTYIADPYNVIYPTEVLDKYGPILKDSAALVGTGPFQLDSYTPKVKARVSKNPAYFQPGAPLLDAVEVTIIDDASTRIASLRSGAIDYLAGLTKDQVGDIKKTNPDLKSGSLAQLAGTCFMFNLANAPVSDIRIRQAIDAAIDREELIALVLGGDGAVTGAPIPPGLGAFSWDAKDIQARYKPDIAKAKQLLSAAGVANGLKVPFMTATDFNAQATTLKAQLLKAGISLDPFDLIEYAAFTDRRIKKDYTASFFSRAQYADPEEFLYKDFHSPPASRNYYNYANPKLDDLLAKQRQESDPAKRAAILHDAQQFIIDDRPVLSLYVGNNNFVWAPRLQGFVANNLRSFSHMADAWWLSA